jgi:hypothetical protein
MRRNGGLACGLLQTTVVCLALHQQNKSERLASACFTQSSLAGKVVIIRQPSKGTSRFVIFRSHERNHTQIKFWRIFVVPDDGGDAMSVSCDPPTGLLLGNV